MFETACQLRHADLAQWLLAHPGISVDQGAVERAVDEQAVEMLAVFIAHDRSWLAVAACRAAASDQVQVLRWIRRRYRGGLTQSVLETAVYHGCIRAVRNLVGNANDIGWDLARVRRAADKVGIRALFESKKASSG
ncbi:hypothetical protein HK105_208337 [Polyrhizophydium stewartii]